MSYTSPTMNMRYLCIEKLRNLRKKQHVCIAKKSRVDQHQVDASAHPNRKAEKTKLEGKVLVLQEALLQKEKELQECQDRYIAEQKQLRAVLKETKEQAALSAARVEELQNNGASSFCLSENSSLCGAVEEQLEDEAKQATDAVAQLQRQLAAVAHALHQKMHVHRSVEENAEMDEAESGSETETW